MTNAAATTDQCLCVAADIAEGTHSLTGCPLDDLVSIYDDDTFVKKDGAGNLCRPGTIIQRILDLGKRNW